MSRLYTAVEVAKAAGISPKSVHFLVRKGKVQARMLGADPVFEEGEMYDNAVAALKAHLETRRMYSAGPPTAVARKRGQTRALAEGYAARDQNPQPSGVILGSETIVAAVQSLESALHKSDALRTTENTGLKTLLGALLATAREHNANAAALLAEMKALRKDMNDAFETLVDRKDDDRGEAVMNDKD